MTRARVQQLVCDGNYTEALGFIAAMLGRYPERTVELLSAGYDIAQRMPDKSRYAQYQSRYFDFGIQPGNKVLDMGSGHIPFPLATHLADITLEEHNVGRAGVPFKHVAGKPVFECSVEQTPFTDKEFDFVYCSHVLEHVQEPVAACRELMRIGKRGYIECPTRGKDTFFATALASNHLLSVEVLNGTLIFTEYSEADKKGVESTIALDMNCSPQSRREKSFAALDVVSASSLNTMLLWDEEFHFEVRRQGNWSDNVRGPRNVALSDALPEIKLANSPLTAICWKVRRRLDAFRSRLARLIEP